MTAGARDQIIGGAWFIPPTPTDWQNVTVARVRRMLIGYDLAVKYKTPPGQHPLDRLGKMGISVLVRLTKEYFMSLTPQEIIQGLEVARSHCSVEALIMSNENDQGFDMSYASKTTWGNTPDLAHGYPQGYVWSLRTRIEAFIDAYRARYGPKDHNSGPALVGGGLTTRMTTPTSTPWPGMSTWNRILYTTMARCDKQALHLYTPNYGGPWDLERLQYAAQIGCSLWQPPFIVDEIGVLHKPESAQVRAYIDFCRYLISAEGQQSGNMGSLIELVVPFTWNGDPQGGRAWPASYLLTEPASYKAIGDFIEHG